MYDFAMPHSLVRYRQSRATSMAITLAVSALAIACNAGGGGTGGAGGQTSSSSGSPPATEPMNVVLADASDGLHIFVFGGMSVGGWLFGASWPQQNMTAEACHSGNDVCHSVSSNGGLLQWATQPSDGNTALAALYYREPAMTYILKPKVGSGCWVWGADVQYYADLGCTVTQWSNSSYANLCHQDRPMPCGSSPRQCVPTNPPLVFQGETYGVCD